MDSTSEERRLSRLDESYGHQLVAPRAVTAYSDPAWQERCYHLLFVDGDLMLDMGRALWPHSGVRRAFVGGADASTQHCVRVEERFLPGDDVDDPCVGAVRVEAVRPLEEVRLCCECPEAELALDLTYTARFAPVAGTPARIEQDGKIVTHYMNFFQSGSYDGWVEIGAQSYQVKDRLGFRDRGWGIRKHEGAPARGLVLGVFCELPDAALYVLLFETASARRLLADGWLIRAAGSVQRVTEIHHDLNFEEGLLCDGRLELAIADGSIHTLELRALARLFLSGVGYSPDSWRQAPGADMFDLTDHATVQQLRGQTDHGCAFELDGVAGYGYVETGLGIHARYRPAEDAS